MFKKALKRTLPFTVGSIIGFTIVYTVMGIAAQINPAFSSMKIEEVIGMAFWVLFTTVCWFCFCLYSIKREDKDDKK